MIGQLRQRIGFQSATESVDSEGQPVKTWGDMDGGPDGSTTEVSAEVRYMTANEMIAMNKPNVTQAVRVRCYYLSSVDEETRFKWRDQTWNIHSVEPDERKFEMILRASRTD